MHIRCPHCRNPIELVDDGSLDDVDCPSCGSNFNLIASANSTNTYVPTTLESLGQFTLKDQLGIGAFGTVWKAYDSVLDRIVALKIPRKDQLTQDEIEKFLREARAAAQLKHPNIVSVHEVGREGQTVFIVSDFIDGLTLTDWLTGQRPTAREAAELCVKIADALHHAHEHGVIHRDLKPGNIMLDRQNEPHIMDFGLAKREAGEFTMTMDGQILGTPAYMSPEQAKGEGHHVDRRTDVYSLGVILYELLTGERPFRGNTRMLIHQLMTDEVPTPRKLNSSIPRDLETICLKAVEKEPGKRYSTSKDMAEDLKRFLSREPISARPISRLGRIARYCKRRPAIATLLLLLFILGVTGPIIAYRQSMLVEAEKEQRQVAVRSSANALLWQVMTSMETRPGEAKALLLDETRIPRQHRDFTWGLLYGHLDRRHRILEGHTELVTSTAFSPDGRFLISADQAGVVKLWDATTGAFLRDVYEPSHGLPIYLGRDRPKGADPRKWEGGYWARQPIQFSRSGSHLIALVGAGEGWPHLLVIPMSGDEQITEVEGVDEFRLSPDKDLIAYKTGHELIVRDLSTAKERKVELPQNLSDPQFCFQESSNHIIVLGKDGRVGQIELDEQHPDLIMTRTLPLSMEDEHAVAICPKGIATISWNESSDNFRVSVFDLSLNLLTTDESISIGDKDRSPQVRCWWKSDCRHLLLRTGRTSLLMKYDGASLKKRPLPLTDSSSLRGARVSENGEIIACVGHHPRGVKISKIRMHCISQERQVTLIDEYHSEYYQQLMQEDTEQVGGDGRVIMYGKAPNHNVLSLTPDGKTVAVADASKKIRLIKNGHVPLEVFSQKLHDREVFYVNLNGDCLTSVAQDMTTIQTDITTGRRIRSSHLPEDFTSEPRDYVYILASTESGRLLTGRLFRKQYVTHYGINVWDIESEDSLLTGIEPVKTDKDIDYQKDLFREWHELPYLTKDGQFLVEAFNPGLMNIWHVETNDRLPAFSYPDDYAGRGAKLRNTFPFYEDKIIRLNQNGSKFYLDTLSLSDGQILTSQRLNLHETGPLFLCGASQENQTICLRHKDFGEGVIWYDLQNHQVILQRNPSELSFALSSWTPDGRTNFTSDFDGSISCWDIALNQLRCRFDTGLETINRIRMSDDGGSLVVCDNTGQVIVYRAEYPN